MKRQRYLPFGYQIKCGEVILHEKESPIVELIFKSYLMGESLEDISRKISLQDVQYSDSVEHWDKNMVRRILDNGKYCSGELPDLISKEDFRQAKLLRQSKVSKTNPYLAAVRKSMVCAGCGSRIYRDSRKPCKILWRCRNCGNDYGPLDDDQLIYEITAALNKMIDSPNILEPARKINACMSIQASRIINEINTEFDESCVDSDKLLSLILKCAEEKYRVCSIGEYEPITMHLKLLIANQPRLSKFDPDLFTRTVLKVILQPDGKVFLKLKNSVLIK